MTDEQKKLIAAGALMGAGGIASYLGDRAAGKKIGEFGKTIEAEGKAGEKVALGQRADYGVGDTYKKFLQYAMEDPMADLQRRRLAEQQAEGTGTLKVGGARAILGGLGAQQSRIQDLEAQIGAGEYGRKTKALQAYGAVEQAVEAEKLRDARTDLEIAREQIASGKELSFQGDLQRKMALYNAVGQATQLASLAVMPQAKNGMKLPGEFSHNRNPIDIMQGGSKIAEATGDEYVINPEQASKIAKQSKYAAQLFKKFDKEA